MQDKYDLIEKKLIPLAKYWSIRLGFLDIIKNTKYFIPLIENRENLGDDLKAMIKISKEWKDKNEHNVGEAATLFRFLQFASWKFNLEKELIKEKTLMQRKICENPDIVNWSISKLMNLDNKNSQWASASILLGNKEEVPDHFFLNLTKEALNHYNKVKEEDGFCEVRYDETLLLQATAFIDLLKTRHTDFKARQPDDYCFSRAFDLISKGDGEKNWLELIGHESNRIEEMEIMLKKLDEGLEIDSKDHRVVQAIAMLALLKNKEVKFVFPDCVSKSWPQFWEFLEYAASLQRI